MTAVAAMRPGNLRSASVAWGRSRPWPLRSCQRKRGQEQTSPDQKPSSDLNRPCRAKKVLLLASRILDDDDADADIGNEMQTREYCRRERHQAERLREQKPRHNEIHAEPNREIGAVSAEQPRSRRKKPCAQTRSTPAGALLRFQLLSSAHMDQRHLPLTR